MKSLYSALTPDGWQLRLDWELVSQDAAEGTSVLRLQLLLCVGSLPAENLDPDPARRGFFRAPGSETDTPYTYSYTALGWHILRAPYLLTVEHGGDGRKLLTLRALWNRGAAASAQLPASLSLEGAVLLPALARPSALLAPELTAGEPATLLLLRGDPGLTHTLTYRLGSLTGEIPCGTDAFVRWTPPLSLCAALPNAETGELTLTLTTFSGGTSVGSREETVLFRVPEELKPALRARDVTVTRVNSPAAEDLGVWICGHSRARVAFSGASLQPGTAAASYSVRCGGRVYTGNPALTDPLERAEETVLCTVTDSRGRTSEPLAVTLRPEPYAPPVLSGVTLRRVESGGTLSLTALASARYSTLDGENAVTLTAQWRTADGEYGTPVTLTPGTERVVASGLDADGSYFLRVTLTDLLGGTAVCERKLPAERLALQLREGGSGAAFGKAAEQSDLLDVAWPIRTAGDLTAQGDLTVVGGAQIGGSLLTAFGTCAAYRTDLCTGALREAGLRLLNTGSTAGLLLVTEPASPARRCLALYALSAAGAQLTPLLEEGLRAVCGSDGTLTVTRVPEDAPAQARIAAVPLLAL